MKAAFEEIIERLERERDIHRNAYDVAIQTHERAGFASYARACEEAIEIVKEAAEEYNSCDFIYNVGKKKPRYVSYCVYEQVACERDVAIGQLRELGYEFGQKIERSNSEIPNMSENLTSSDVPDNNVGENGWIPCSERLPEERDWYLAVFQEPDTGFIGLPYIADYLLGQHTKYTTNDGWIIKDCTDFEDACGYYKELMCIAWQPLPAPYQPKGEQ